MKSQRKLIKSQVASRNPQAYLDFTLHVLRLFRQLLDDDFTSTKSQMFGEADAVPSINGRAWQDASRPFHAERGG